MWLEFCVLLRYSNKVLTLKDILVQKSSSNKTGNVCIT